MQKGIKTRNPGLREYKGRRILLNYIYSKKSEEILGNQNQNFGRNKTKHDKATNDHHGTD